MERNSLVLTGKMTRVFVCEVEPGDVTAFGETVERVVRHGDARVSLHMADGSVHSFGRVGSTILVETLPDWDNLAEHGNDDNPPPVED